METLENIGDLDYLTHIVFRMYERFDFVPTDPRRFRVEILLSTGVGLDPFKRNVIQEFEKAAADAHRREKSVSSPGAVTGQRRKSEDAASLPLVRQFPVQNDRAKAPRRAADEEAAAAAAAAAAGAGEEKGKDHAAAKRERNAAYLTLDDLETYLWKFRRNKSGGLGVAGGGAGGGHGSSASDGAFSPKKEALPGRISFSKEERKKSYLGGPKRSKERKKKGSDSESE
jgi:inositol hexakisphosphate/diphosphoinositol-pentakisphosphate kinase